MAKPRFLLIYDFLHSKDFGGLEQLMATHARMLNDAGYKTKLLFADIDPIMYKNEIYQGLELEEYGSKKLSGTLKIMSSILGLNNLKHIIKPNNIIISYSFPVNMTIKKFDNIKINYVNHFPHWLYLKIPERWVWANNSIRKIAFFYSLVLGPITKHYDQKYIKKCDLVFMNSKFTKRRLDSLYEINGIVSYPPVDSIFKPSISNNILDKFQIKGSYLFSSGRIIPDKRIDLLLEAYAKSKQQIPLIISGKGSELNNLNRLAEQLNIKDKVKFVGFVTTEELIHLYSSAEAYIMPTPKEDYGLGTVQAISCGCPLIVWDDNGGSCEQCIDGTNGYKAKPYDIEDMAKKIDLCIDSKFKETHSKEILESARIFSEEEQRDIFINGIISAIKPKDLNTGKEQ